MALGEAPSWSAVAALSLYPNKVERAEGLEMARWLRALPAFPEDLCALDRQAVHKHPYT